jgi:hypothetical protein
MVFDMTLQDIASIAEIAGAVAVVISLIYVGLQVRQNTAAVQSATAQAVHDNYAAWYINLSNDPSLNDLVIKGLRDYSVLDQTEKARFIDTFMAFSSYCQNAFYQWKQGALSPQLWLGWESLIMNLVGTPGGKDFWKERGYTFGSEYRDYIADVIMKKAPHPEARPLGAFKLE